MQISEVRVKLVQGRTDRLKAFCSVTFDNMFVVRDIKVIEGTDGYFVAMPSRKLTDRCPSCGSKNNLRSKFCTECGARLGDTQGRIRNQSGRTKLHADMAHPINQEARNYMQGAIVEAFTKELELAKQPGYRPQSLDEYDEDYYEDRYHSQTGSSGGARASGGEAEPVGEAEPAGEAEAEGDQRGGSEAAVGQRKIGRGRRDEEEEKREEESGGEPESFGAGIY